MATSKHTKAKIRELMKQAKESGIEKDYLFLTTLERYETQVKILSDLKETIEAENTLVTKEYVKGRENIYTHPAIAEYNKTVDSANKTVTTLDSIIKSRSEALKATKETDPLMQILKTAEEGQ